MGEKIGRKIYKLFDNIGYFFYKKYTLSKLHFTSEEAKKSCVLGKNVTVTNPNVMLGDHVVIYDGAVFWGNGKIQVDDRAFIGFNTVIFAHEGAGVHIGAQCAIAANCYIIDTNHSTKALDLNASNPIGAEDTFAPIEIGKNVWIAAQCVIAKGVTLGDGAIVGANSFVDKSFSANAIVAGSPAKYIRDRG